MNGFIQANSFFQGIFSWFFLFGITVLFVVSIILLRPFRAHKKRKFSTISIKVSYLLFLGFFLACTYVMLFDNPPDKQQEGFLTDPPFPIRFLIFATATIIPNVGIMIRQRFKKKRVEYNILLTIINLLYAIYLAFLIFAKDGSLFK